MHLFRLLPVPCSLALVLCVTDVLAQSVQVPQCTRATATLSPVTVAGFRGEKVRIFAAHPLICGALPGRACTPIALISSGASVTAAANCHGWTFVQASQGMPNLRGWMATRRLLPPTDSESVPQFFEEPDPIDSAAEPAVCDAASKGTVENVLLSDIVPYSLPYQQLLTSAQAADAASEDSFEIVALGDADVDNDGDLDRIGWAVSSPPSAGRSPSPINMEWPVILAADGTLRPQTPLNALAFSHSGNDVSGRLFTYRGATYFELQSRLDSNDHVHEVWRFTKSDAKKICTFSGHESSTP